MSLSNSQYLASSTIGAIAGLSEPITDGLILGLTGGFTKGEFYSQAKHSHQMTSCVILGYEFLTHANNLSSNYLSAFAITTLIKTIVTPWATDQIHDFTHHNHSNIHHLGENFWSFVG